MLIRRKYSSHWPYTGRGVVCPSHDASVIHRHALGGVPLPTTVIYRPSLHMCEPVMRDMTLGNVGMRR